MTLQPGGLNLHLVEVENTTASAALRRTHPPPQGATTIGGT